MAASLTSKALPNGEIVITLVDEAQAVHGLVVKAAKVGNFVVEMLASAMVASPFPPAAAVKEGGREVKDVIGIRPSQIDISENEHGISLILHFGLAKIGVGIKPSVAIELGQSLMAAGAPRTRAQ